MSSKGHFTNLVLVAAGSLVVFGCAPETQPLPPHPALTVGGEVFHILCKRVAAAADSVDPSGVQYNPPCNGTGPVPASSMASSDPRFVAMVERRDELVGALDQVFGDKTAPSTATFGTGELDAFLKDLIPFYDPPDEITPVSTRAIAAMMQKLISDEPIPKRVRSTLQRVAPRVGYRPINQILGALRPALTYPGLDDLSRHFLGLLGKGGKANGIFVDALKAGALELAENAENTPNDQRTLRKATELLFATDSAMADSTAAPLWVVKRNDQGAAVLTELGARIPPNQLPSPFARQRNLLGDASQCPHGYDQFGRAADAQCNLIYEYFDANRTVLAGLMREQYPLLTRNTPNEPSTVEKLARGLRPILGPTAMRVQKFGDANAQLSFKGPDVQQGALFDLVHAGSQLLKYDETVRLLKVLDQLMRDHENEAAGPIWAGLEIDRLADQPEYAGAHLVGLDGEGTPQEFWDDLIDVGMRMLDRPGQLEAVLRSFSKAESAPAAHLIAKFMTYKDHVGYGGEGKIQLQSDGTYSQADADTFNAEVVHTFSEKVDRTQPDVGMNRSLWQRLISTIHATNGAENCNKQDAIATVSGPLGPLQFPHADATQMALIGCSDTNIVGEKYARCEFVRQPNGAEAHMRSILGKSAVVVKDQQLLCAAPAEIPLLKQKQDIGEEQEKSSQIKGFTLAPTPQAIARFIYVPRVKFLTDLFDEFPTKHGVPLKAFEPDILFSLEMTQPDVVFNGATQSFLTASKSLGEAFDNTEYFEKTEDGEVATKGYMFAELLATLHLHWPSRRVDPMTGMNTGCAAAVQPGDEGCSQSLDPKKPFYSPQSNLVSYEPLLIKSIEDVKLAELLQKSSAKLAEITVDGKDGITVLSDFLKLALTVDPDLTYRDGRKYSATNACSPMETMDPMSGELKVACANGRGRVLAGVTPLYLLLDALAGIDRAFEGDDDTKERHQQWLAARSKLVDQLLTVDSDNPADPASASYRLHNRRAYATTLQLIPWLLNRIQEHKDANDLESWADGLTGRLSDVLGHPVTAAGLDLLDVVWNELATGNELSKFSAYLMDEQGHPDAFAGLIVAAVDTLNTLDRDPDLTPLVQFASLALAPNAFEALATAGEAKPNVENSPAYTGLELTRRISDLFMGPEASTLAKLLKNAVLPDSTGKSPLEVFIDTAAEVNRVVPSEPADKPLLSDDYKNVFDQTQLFLSDKDRGMERLYLVVQGRNLTPSAQTAQNTATTTGQANP